MKLVTQWQWFTAGCIILLICVSVFGLMNKSIGSSQSGIASSEVGPTAEQEEPTGEKATVTPKQEDTNSQEEPPSIKTEENEEMANEEAEESNQEVTDYKISIIGDSVMLNVEPYIKNYFPNTFVDASIGRQMYESTDLIKKLNQNNNLGDIVIIALGTNGAFTNEQLNDVIQAAGAERKIILINTRVPRNWESIVNKRLAEAAADHSSIHLIDWYSISSGHNEYFENDGVHLTQTGAKAYAEMIAAEIRKQ